MKDSNSEIGKMINEIKELLEIEDEIVDKKEDSVSKIILKEENTDYSVHELGKILNEMYNRPNVNKSTAIHMFGLKYGDIIKNNNYTATSIIEATNINSSYHAEVSKGIRMYEAILNNEYGIKFYEENINKGNVIESHLKSTEKVLPKLPPRINKEHSLNRILYGAPGTGKTYNTSHYALAIVEKVSLDTIKEKERSAVMERYNQFIKNGQIVFTTFHQSYGYEDFIQGIRPDTSAKDMVFKTVDGAFKIIAERAMEKPDKNYVIIIDEINRASISKVFGELITLIEDDKRWGEENAMSVTLPSGEIFAVPNNLYIVGTMNSADKSISLVDIALRRRFEFIEFEPDLSKISDMTLKVILEKLNASIAKELNSTDLLIGHSYFMNKTEADICEVMNRSIIPLLYEYFLDNQKKVEVQVKNAVDGLDVEIKSGTMGRIKLVKKGE